MVLSYYYSASAIVVVLVLVVVLSTTKRSALDHVKVMSEILSLRLQLKQNSVVQQGTEK
jgi:hypothetical protein